MDKEDKKQELRRQSVDYGDDQLLLEEESEEKREEMEMEQAIDKINPTNDNEKNTDKDKDNENDKDKKENEHKKSIKEKLENQILTALNMSFQK